MKTEDRIKKSYQVAVIIAIAFIFSLGTYIIAVEVLKSTNQIGVGNLSLETLLQLRYIIYGVGVAAIILIRWLRGIMLRKSPGENEEILINRLFRSFIISFALSEIPALLGLVLFILGGFIKDFYILTVISFVLMFMFFPRYPHWRDWVQASRSANCCYPR